MNEQNQTADSKDLTVSKVVNYLNIHETELSQNSYEILKGNRLKILKESISGLDVPETDFGNISKSLHAISKDS